MRKPPYPPSPPTPMQQKQLKKMMGKARGMKVDPLDYVRPPSRITKPFKAPFRGGPSKIIKPYKKPPSGGKQGGGVIQKPYKGPKINRDDDLRNMLPRQKPKPSKPRGNPNATYRIVPAKKRIGKAIVPKSSEPKPPSNTKYPPASSHKQLAPRPKRGSREALLPYQGPKRNSKRK